jgi:TIM-barrel protein, nifR3 family
MFEETGCTAVMIGRGAQGNPWIFEEVRDYLSGRTVQKPSAADRYAVLLEHFESLIRFKGAHIALREMRSHASWYTKGLFGSAALRERINRTSTVEEFRQVISEVAKCTV